MGLAALEGIGMKTIEIALRSFALAAAMIGGAAHAAAEPLHEICIIVGAPGEPAYSAGFAAAAHAWQDAAVRGGATVSTIGLEPESADRADRAQLQERIAAWANEGATSAATPVWLVYLGHGTFDGREARLSLRGPDVSAPELADWLKPLRRPLVFIHGGSASAPFIPALSGANRIIVSATQSGHEVNYARFGERFAAAVASPAADIDQDGQTSVLEAFVASAQQTQAFYAETARLATEHALIDDNGDRQGTPAEWFRGTRVQRRPEGRGEPDGDRARLLALVPLEDERRMTPQDREQRDHWERELAALRARKAHLPEDQYYAELERILRQLAAIYRRDT